MIKDERDKEVASITLATAQRINECSAEFSTLIDVRKGTPWWRFMKRRRLKRKAATMAAMNVMTAVIGAAQIYVEISRPIPKYPSGV